MHPLTMQRSLLHLSRCDRRLMCRSPLTFRVWRCVSSSATSKRAGKTSKMRMSELPQGLLADALLPPTDDKEQSSRARLPSVIRQAIDNMHRFPDCVVLTRVGSFYELYAEQAKSIGALLNLKIASKRAGNGRVAMAGFPFFQLERYLKVLVQEHGRHVAISEEFVPDPDARNKSGAMVIDRQVKRVVTPGTLIDEHFLTPYEHNYLLAVSLRPDSKVFHENISEMTIGLAWLDLSSGDFFAQTTNLGSFESAIARIGPREVIIEQNLDSESLLLRPIFSEQKCTVSYVNVEQTETSDHELIPIFEDAVTDARIDEFTEEERSSSQVLLKYVQKQLPGIQLRFQPPIRHKSENFTSIDKNSLRGLEITQTLRDGHFKGSLLHAVRRTATESGARLLSDRLTAPSLSLAVINDRLDLVETFLSNKILLEEATNLLERTSDMLRLLQKFALGRGSAEELLSLSRTTAVTESIRDLLQSHGPGTSRCLQRLISRFSLDSPTKLANRILSIIDEEGLMLKRHNEELAQAHAADMARSALDGEMTSDDMAKLSKRLHPKKFIATEIDTKVDAFEDGEVWVMRRHASPLLEDLHSSLQQLLSTRLELEMALQGKLSAKSLSLKWTPGLGHIAHVKGRDTKLDLSLVAETTRDVSSSKSTRSFYYKPWSELGSRIESTKSQIRVAENALFTTLRNGVIQNLVALRRNAGVLDDVDVACSFARLAAEQSLVRPRLTSGTTHRIFHGRHLMVEASLSATRGNAFTPNDCTLGGNGPRIWLITGPNMAGKSTFLRQTALISILAQTGSFVPAAHAEMGLVDAIFSRIGSADNTSQEQSTFMVEMLETAHILRHATSRSLVVMDEVGRGTTPEDGIAVGYAVLKFLHNTIRCRTLFATHFHELADLTRDFPSIECRCTDVINEDDGSFRYDHRLKPGVNRESHALKVAQMARMPEVVIQDAAGCLARLQSG